MVMDEKNRDLDVKVRIACRGCGMLVHLPKDCHLAKGNCHICLGHPEGSSLCKDWVAEQFLHLELRGSIQGVILLISGMVTSLGNGRLSGRRADGRV